MTYGWDQTVNVTTALVTAAAAAAAAAATAHLPLSRTCAKRDEKVRESESECEGSFMRLN